MNGFWSVIFSAGFVATIIRVTTPIIFASMACLIAKKAGCATSPLKAPCWFPPWRASWPALYLKNVWLARPSSGCWPGVGIGLFLGYFHIIMDTDIWLTGIAINLIANGGTVFAMFAITGDKGSTANPGQPYGAQHQHPHHKGHPHSGEILSGLQLFTYLAIVSVIVMYCSCIRPLWAFRIRAVGKYSMAAESVGENSNRIKLIALALSGMFASFGGMFISCPMPAALCGI